MKDKRFSNPYKFFLKRGVKDVFLWKMGFYDDLEPSKPIGSDFIYPLPALQYDPIKPCVTWINHSSFLVRIQGYHLLFDPIWSDRCSPFSGFGPKRSHPPGILFSQLPHINCVLISHDHYDHLDKQTVTALFKTFPDVEWIVPTGVKKRFDKWGIPSTSQLGWWDTKIVPLKNGLEMRVTAVPAQHFSGRTLWDRNRTLWVGWVVEFYREDKLIKCLYFVGDTGYNPVDFKKIAERFPHIDLTLIPIGTYVPKKFMQPVHISPLEAVWIHKEVRSHLSIGMHWKTFQLSDEPREQPPYDLLHHLCQEKIDPSTFLVLEPGHEINW